MALAAAIGALIGATIFVFARSQRFDRDRSFYPTVLIVIASYYVLFASIAGRPAEILAELAFALAFGVLALTGLKFGTRVVAAGITFHGVFDLARLRLGAGSGTPIWWPVFCAAIDIVLGLAVLIGLYGDKRLASRP